MTIAVENLNLLAGSVRLSKRLRRHPVWNREPFSYGQAWVDLVLLANDRPRAVTLRNGDVLDLERGQLAWALRTLENEWDRSGEWIDRFLKFCRDQAMIKLEKNTRRTVITILNYDTYNLPVSETEPVTETETEPGAKPEGEPERKGEVGRGNRELGRGEGASRPGHQGGEPANSEIPGDEMVADFCKNFKDLARGIEAIPEVWWTGWLALQLKRTPNFGFPRDWRRVIALDFVSDWIQRHPKAIGTSHSYGTGEKNGKKPSTWELTQQLEAYKRRWEQHEANETSSAWMGDPSPEALEEAEKIRASISSIEQQLRAVPAGQT